MEKGQEGSGDLTKKEPNKMQVKFWDGDTKDATNREEAVQIIKTGLDGWMEKGYTIRWYKRPEDPNPPSHAFVFNELGEETDAWATIKEVPE